MPPALSTALTLISGISWTIVYLAIIYRGFKDKTYGMPLFALAFNFAWELIYDFLVRDAMSVQKVVNMTWFVLDAVIVYTYFRYGRKDFPKQFEKFFISWSILAFLIAFATLYFAAFEFKYPWGSIYSAFAQNLMMSILFVTMLVRRDSVDGQSMAVAIFKWVGTLAPTIQVYVLTGSSLVLILGIGCFIYDVIYIAMLYRKFHQLNLNPFTRRALSKTVTES